MILLSVTGAYVLLKSKQQIYNQIFNRNKFDIAQQCFGKLKTMPEDIQIKIYKYITSLETQIKIGKEIYLMNAPITM